MTKSNQSSLDIADHLSRGEYDWCPEAETRLKEQHDRIKVLEINHKIQLNINEKSLQYIIELEKANVYAVNKLKECVDKIENNRHNMGISEAIGFEKGYNAAKPSELTDDEINEIFGKTWLDFQDYKEFAKAILRKAQEK